MDLKGGEVVSLIHYSGKYTLMGVVYQASDGLLEVIPLQQHSLFNFFEEDPIVIGYKTKNEINLCQCIVRNVDFARHHLALKINDSRSNTDKRLFERFPISAYADIQDNNGAGISFVKNLSIGGAGIVSKHDLIIGDNIKMNLFIDKAFVPLHAKIVWKLPNKPYFNYGLKFIYPDVETKTMIKEYLQALKEEHGKNFKQFKIAYKRRKSKSQTELNYDHVCL